MARKLLIRSRELPYHVTCRGNNREAFPLPLQVFWNCFLYGLITAQKEHGALIHSFVLMPNHFHLLVSTPDKDLGEVMRHFMRDLTQVVNRLSTRSGRIFGSKYHWSLVDHDQYLDAVIKYIYRNPVKAKLCSDVNAYSFSSIHALTGGQRFPVKLSPVAGHNTLVPQNNLTNFLEWLNKPFPGEEDGQIQKGLRRTRFVPVEPSKQEIILSSFK